MGAALDGLENEYLDDMMGTGFTFFGMGDSNFGFLNMILCDTRGNPLTNHHRKSSNRKGYVDFATNVPNGGETSPGDFSHFYKVMLHSMSKKVNCLTLLASG